MWATSFEDCACREFIDPARAFRGGPVLDLDFLFDEVIGRRRALSEAGLAAGPEFRAVAVSATHAELRVLRDFESAADLLAAVRASCAIPVLTGAPPTYRGEPMVDGGLLEPIPYRTALREGATHVLVLRSREASYRAAAQDKLAERVLARAHPELAPLLHSCSRRYNRDAAELQRRPRHRRSCGRSRCRPAAAWCRGSAPTPPASPTTSGWARARWRPRSTASGATRFWRPFPELLRWRRSQAACCLAGGWAPSQAACCLAGGRLAGLERVAQAPPLGDAAVDHVDHLARARAQDEARGDRGPLAGAADDRDRALPGRARRAARRCRARA